MKKRLFLILLFCVVGGCCNPPPSNQETVGIKLIAGDYSEENINFVVQAITTVLDAAYKHRSDEVTLKALESLSKSLDSDIQNCIFSGQSMNFWGR